MATVTLHRSGFGPTGERRTVTDGSPPPTVTITGASDASESPRWQVLAIAYGLLAAAAVWALTQNSGLGDPLVLAMGANAFALFYLAAQFEERLIEPFSQVLLSTDETEKQADTEKKGAIDAGTLEDAQASANAAATKVSQLNRLKRERAILFWCLASVVGILLSMWLRLYFFAAILDPGAATSVPRWADVVATGLVIGGGSKGVHDLIERLQKKSDSNSDSA